MKKAYFYFLLTCSLATASWGENLPSEKELYDVIIIGGGVAGLTAAYKLREHKVLLLEKNDYFGGRVLTKKWNHLAYDLGAIVPFATHEYALGPSDRKIGQTQGLVWVGQEGVIRCGKMMDCLAKMNLSPEDLTHAQKFIDRQRNLEDLGPQLTHILRTFFRIWYPNEISQAPANFQRYFTSGILTQRYEQGMSQVTDPLAKALEGRAHLNHLVEKVTANQEQVEVSVSHAGVKKKYFGRYAIIATGPSVVEKIFKEINSQAKNLLHSIVPRGGLTLAAVVRGENLSLAATVVDHKDFNKIFSVTSINVYPNIYALGFYFIKNNFAEITSEKEVGDFVKNFFQRVFPGRPVELLHFDSQIWPFITFDVSEEFLKNISTFNGQLAPRVFAAGDYLGGESFYGVNRASFSGRQVAKKLNSLLALEKK